MKKKCISVKVLKENTETFRMYLGSFKMIRFSYMNRIFLH